MDVNSYSSRLEFSILYNSQLQDHLKIAMFIALITIMHGISHKFCKWLLEEKGSANIPVN